MYNRICIFQTKSNIAVSADVILSTGLTGSATSNANLDCIENSPATIFLTCPAMLYDLDPPWHWYLSSLLGICAFTSPKTFLLCDCSLLYVICLYPYWCFIKTVTFSFTAGKGVAVIIGEFPGK